MFEEEKVAFFLASRLIARGNKGTLALTITIIAMVFVNLIFLPSIIPGIVVLFNQQNIDYSYGNLVIEPRENQLVIANVADLQQKMTTGPWGCRHRSTVYQCSNHCQQGKIHDTAPDCNQSR